MFNKIKSEFKVIDYFLNKYFCLFNSQMQILIVHCVKLNLIESVVLVHLAAVKQGL